MIATGKMVAVERFKDGIAMRQDWANHEQSPRLRELLRVVAIGQTVSRGNASITLLSLETFAEGFAFHGLYRLEDGHPVLDEIGRIWEEVRRNEAEAQRSATDDDARVKANLGILSRMPIGTVYPSVTDDRGNQYKTWLLGERGLAAEGRFSYGFAPPLDPAAREVQFEIPALHWLVLGPGEYSGIAGDSQVGPWTFLISLTGNAGE